MQTRKRFLQEWKKCFKVRLVFGHYITPMKVRKTFKKDSRLLILFSWQAVWCYSVQRKISFFPSKNLKIYIFFSTIRSLLLSKTVYQGREEYKTTDIVERKKKPLKISVQSEKDWVKKKKYIFWFLTRKWNFDPWSINVHNLQFCKAVTGTGRGQCHLLFAVTKYLFFLFALSVEAWNLRFALACLLLYDFVFTCDLLTDVVVWNQIHHQKWRNFEKFSLKVFKQIEVKKNESIVKYFLGRLQKNIFCKHLNKSVSLFFEENSNLFKPFFGRETYVHRKMIGKSFLHQN